MVSNSPTGPVTTGFSLGLNNFGGVNLRRNADLPLRARSTDCGFNVWWNADAWTISDLHGHPRHYERHQQVDLGGGAATAPLTTGVASV
jgi:hypothetical protein